MIRVENLNKYFFKGEERELHALKDINLTIAKGEYSLFTGPSGCGKTTLLNAIGGLDSIDSGKVYLNDIEISQLSEDERTKIRLEKIGFVFQAYNLIPVLSVEENIGFIMKLRGFSNKEINARVKEVASLLEIDTKLKSLPNTLSGGQQQRVAVARAVAAKPELILADEPTANLDSKNSESLMNMMRSLNEKEGVSIIFASHDEYVLSSVDRVIKLNDGEIIES
ncbi:ATP-binding cassette domain-containing protein [Sulfurimonas aquatica]|uniref:ATP-binding cassette domain-containing protein n=1 Tax=Sulfurimonas aquatica TaxID=2672570 RepID=A0A975B0T1_9BACT|nr:ABC transporter ATP-binding protein [Sulfurimonas aquatica]QSZ42018.1 ATP-binding cassette domain-containing protein [Sulfurimonas aquatica]